ncbi:MAG: hypothetical protein GXP54_00930 [Deltaproteobacteria bacterium]|nr:hypothetical protein [Deltaproteobacteria bacterium]
MALCASVGCRGPKPDRTSVRGTFALYMGISTRGNYEAIYPLLASQVRQKIAIAHRNIRECVRLIEEHFPQKLKAAALESLGPPALRSAPTPDKYLAALMNASGRPALDIRERLASKIKRIRETIPGTFRVTTVSGATLRFVREGDGRFYLVPPRRDCGMIQDEYTASLKLLNAAKRMVESLEHEG